jgi:hypothetical protein
MSDDVDMFKLYSVFDYGNNPAFDRQVEKWLSEASAARASGQTLKPLADYLQDWIVVTNQQYGHTAFVEAIKNKRAKVRWLVEPYTITNHRERALFAILACGYQFAPFVLFPVLALVKQDWWLLLGILLSFAASRFAAQNYTANKSTAPTITFAIVVFSLFSLATVWWLRTKFGHNFPFAAMSCLWGFLFFTLAEVTQIKFAMRNLLERAEIFAAVAAQNKIVIEPTPS